MQTILGANGQIATILAKELNARFSDNLRLVSRNPRKVNKDDQLFSADLRDKSQTNKAVEGSKVVYLAVGLPMETTSWAKEFPMIMRNVIDACITHDARLVFFDNTYMYPQTERVLTEETSFAPVGEKGRIRAAITELLLNQIERGSIEAVICRAPEFYGPGKTQSITNSLIFNNIRNGKELKLYLRDDKLRTLIWTPDAGRATALIGNTPDAYGQTWHLPCDDNRLTYAQMITLASEIFQKELSYRILSRPELETAASTDTRIQEILELLPRYEHDNIFSSSKFKIRFPEFVLTSYRQGLQQIKNEQD